MAVAAVVATGALALPAHSAPAGPDRPGSSASSAKAGAPSARIRDAAISRAEANVTRHAATFGYGKDQALVAKDVVVDRDGTEHVRFDRTYRQLPVVGGDFVVHQTRAGKLVAASHAKARKVAVDSVRPGVSAKSTESQALKGVTGVRGAEPDAELIVWAADGTPRLAWRTTVAGTGAHGEPAGKIVVTDADSGQRIETYDAEHQEAGTGHSEYTGDVTIDTTKQADGTYALIDPTRGTITRDAHNVSSSGLNSGSGTLFTDADNIWGDGQKFSTDRATAAVDAHANTAKTWDYYRDTFGRNGIRNDGKGATVFVHVGTHWDNAQWSDNCFCMMTGDGDGTTDPEQVDLDTMGHEMTHGVTSATADLRYSGESGGLNEATSDIFGTMVEWYADNAIDTPDYLFSDQSTPPWLRRMDKPSLDGRSADYWSRKVGKLDVHLSSGVGNHWFYLASEGSGAKTINGVGYNSPTYDNSKVTGIGNQKAAAIWYRALTVYMTSTTDYKGARAATLKAAADLYGATSGEYRTVGAAWTAVNVA
ncbi:M4 family metallopeptidase [Streptomyces ochraceiscleroticus]|uniref:Neutral metalloproteinase n=1 Tax=Streptomyces ochraceiscleroticus TaxID=47761 RepID=A0ABW1MBW9_9ACTN|nr:M4 family metallopeptidase [Streptomyces ochraceiscleroticus]